MCDDCGRVWKIKYLIGGQTHWSEVGPLLSAWYRRIAKSKGLQLPPPPPPPPPPLEGQGAR
jgi:hypothetical protein